MAEKTGSGFRVDVSSITGEDFESWEDGQVTGSFATAEVSVRVAGSSSGRHFSGPIPLTESELASYLALVGDIAERVERDFGTKRTRAAVGRRSTPLPALEKVPRETAYGVRGGVTWGDLGLPPLDPAAYEGSYTVGESVAREARQIDIGRGETIRDERGG